MTPSRREVVTPLADFAGLYREHAAAVHRFAVYLSGDPPLADDLVSEAFVRVWTARERVELATVRGYLLAIVRNLFLRHLRHERRRAPLDERLADGRPDPEVRASDQSTLQTVLSALDALPEADRSAVLMRANGELPYEEIAAVLRISVTAAKVKVHRARLKLAEAAERDVAGARRKVPGS
jgi:RNA polymerase sigma-70 factor (ECF subfamily)